MLRRRPPLRSVGTDPDYRFTLANERTFLAWLRTALALLAGAVALADEWSGVYPRASSGGWQLIGTTDLAMWDAHRESPALLTPGRLVRFTSLASGSSVAAASEDADATESRGRS